MTSAELARIVVEAHRCCCRVGVVLTLVSANLQAKAEERCTGMATQLENAQRKCAEAEAAHAALQASSKLLEQQHAELQQKQAEQASGQGEGRAAAGDPLPKLSVIHLTSLQFDCRRGAGFDGDGSVRRSLKLNAYLVGCANPLPNLTLGFQIALSSETRLLGLCCRLVEDAKAHGEPPDAL